MKNLKDIKPCKNKNRSIAKLITDDQVIEIVDIVDWVLDNYSDARKVGGPVFKYLDKEWHRPSTFKDVTFHTYTQYMKTAVKIAIGDDLPTPIKLPIGIATKLIDYYNKPYNSKDTTIIPTENELRMLIQLRNKKQ